MSYYEIQENINNLPSTIIRLIDIHTTTVVNKNEGTPIFMCNENGIIIHICEKCKSMNKSEIISFKQYNRIRDPYGRDILTIDISIICTGEGHPYGNFKLFIKIK